MSIRRRALILLLLAATLASPACRRRAAEVSEYNDEAPRPAEPLVRQLPEVGRHGGRFVLGQTVNPKTFNGMMASETSSTDITQLVDASLVRFDNATQQFVPELATSWEVSSSGTTWTFHLRRGAAFSDGRPITSADVLFSFDVAYDPVLHQPVQDLIKSGNERFRLSAPDPQTVVIDTITPNSALLDALCQGGLPILPKHVLEGPFKEGAFASAYNVATPPERLVGGGPFRVVQYVAGEKTVLGRNPHYFAYDQNGQRLPYLDEVVFLIVPDQDAADLKFRSGGLDGLSNVKPENYRWYEDNQKAADFTLHDLGPAVDSNFFWFNLGKVQPPLAGQKLPAGKRPGDPYVDPSKYALFSDVRFRRAVSMGVDRDAMITSIFFGQGEKSWSQASRGNKVWHVPDLVHYDYNPSEAKRLLAEMGLRDVNGDGFLDDSRGNPAGFVLKTNADNALRVAMSNFIRDDLAKIGIRVTLAPVDFNTLITNITNDYQYEAALLGLQSGVPPTPANGQNVYRSAGETHFWFPKQQKPATKEEARIDQLLDEILRTQDLAAQKKHYAELLTIMNDQGWFVWLPILKVKLPVSNRFGNVQPSIMAHRLLWNAERLFVKRRDS